MEGFDENEAEEIASNWVQNLRFRFARMGLNYHSESLQKSNDKVDDQAKKSPNDVEGRISNTRRTSRTKEQGVLSDLHCRKSDNLKSFESKQFADLSLEDVKCPTSHKADKPNLNTAGSGKSQLVNLESLREKRLNFFQQNKNLTPSKTFDNNDCLKSCDTINESAMPNKLQKVLNESIECQNDNCYTKPTISGWCDALYNKPLEPILPTEINVKNKFENEDSNTRSSSSESLEDVGWASSKFNTVHSSKHEEIAKRSKDDRLGLDWWGLNDLSTANEYQQYQPINASIINKSSTKVTADNLNNKEVSSYLAVQDISKSESKDTVQVFPLELYDDDDEFETRAKNYQQGQQDVLVDRLDYDSDSDSDFTLDDPISRHSSPRVEESPAWGRLRKNSGAMSPLVQSTSPPVPQITGALYHEFSCSKKELDPERNVSKAEKIVAVGNNNESGKSSQRPRSLSHPSTARDCSERCGSCCCANPNQGIDVVCNVSTTKDYVDVEISYQGDSNGCESLISNGWLKTRSKHGLSKQDNKTSTENSKSYFNSLHFESAHVCLECNMVNHSESNLCLKCGAILLSAKPVSSKLIDLHRETAKAGNTLKPQISNKVAEPTNELRQSQLTRKSDSIPRSNSDSHGEQVLKNKPAKQNDGRRWEKSNLAWSTYKDSHLAKPPNAKNIKNHPRKSSIARESADGPRPRSTSCRNAGKRVKPDNGSPAPGSLPRSYKFKEFKNKKGTTSDHGAANLTLKGKKAVEKKASNATDKNGMSDCSKYDEITEMIRTNREKPLPYLCLPDEIILRIFYDLSQSDLARCSRVCRQLERIAQDEILWRTIVLRRENVSDEVLEKIGAKRPVSLSLIRCHGNLVTSCGLRELFRRCAENLEELNFIGCSGGQLIGESILLHVALRCNNLRSVDASWSNVGDNGVEALVQNVERLECLCLNGCQAITDHSLKVVADKHGDSLRTFEIFGCFNVSAAAIKRLGQKCPNLETLNLGQCYKITSSDIGRLVSHLVSIVNLDLRGCKKARDACVKTIVKHCPHLINLVLANCPLITDVAMAEIATNLSAVRCLDVCGCVKVTDHGVRALARSCNRLNSLDLSSTSITQKSVMLLANYCSQNLQSLKLSFCVDVTDDSVSRLVKHCKRMKTLHLYGCKRLRNVKALQELNQSLKLEF